MTDYFVDFDAAPGGDGLSPSTPWYQLRDMNIATLDANSTVWFKRGTSFQNLTTTTSTYYNVELKSNIRYTGAPYPGFSLASDPLPIIKSYGRIMNTGWVDNGNGTWYKNTTGYLTYTSTGLLYQDDTALRRASSVANIGVDGEWFWETGTNILTYKPPTDNPADYQICVDTGVALFYSVIPNINNVQIDNLEIVGSGHGVYIREQPGATQDLYNFTIKNCKIWNAKISPILIQYGNGSGTGYNATNITITDNEVYYSKQGISLYSSTSKTETVSNSIISNNYIHDINPNNIKYEIVGGDVSGIGFQNANNCTFSGNTLDTVTSWPLTPGTDYAANGLEAWTNSSIISTNTIFSNNYINNVPGCAIVCASYGTEYNIRNNIVTNSNYLTRDYQDNAAIKLNGVTGANKCYNNTVIDCYNGISVQSNNNWSVKNNIVYNSTDMHIFRPAGYTLDIDYNMYYPDGNKFSNDDGSTKVPFSSWTYDTNGYLADPLLDSQYFPHNKYIGTTKLSGYDIYNQYSTKPLIGAVWPETKTSKVRR